MALQGTLETFALPDVLRLLASTKKTGCYRLDGDRGSGRLWVRDGQIIAGDVSGSPAVTDPAEVAFEMLRFDHGEFHFQGEAEPAEDGGPIEVEALLSAADQMLVEWRDIEAVVPSLATWVNLRAELPDDEVTIRADKWVSVVAIGGGCTVGQLGGVLGLGELPASRIVKELLDLGILELHEAAEEGIPAAYEQGYQQPTYEQDYDQQPTYEQGYDQQPAYEQPQPEYEQPTYEQGYDTGGYDETYDDSYQTGTVSALDQQGGYGYDAPDGNVVEFSPYGETEDAYQNYETGTTIDDNGYGADLYGEPEPLPPPPVATGRTATNGDTDPTDAAEIARQLANLSPKAAKAVAAAAKATTQAEREAALAQVDETKDPINRELLLKFLGSVNS